MLELHIFGVTTEIIVYCFILTQSVAIRAWDSRFKRAGQWHKCDHWPRRREQYVGVTSFRRQAPEIFLECTYIFVLYPLMLPLSEISGGRRQLNGAGARLVKLTEFRHRCCIRLSYR